MADTTTPPMSNKLRKRLERSYARQSARRLRSITDSLTEAYAFRVTSQAPTAEELSAFNARLHDLALTICEYTRATSPTALTALRAALAESAPNPPMPAAPAPKGGKR